MFLVAEEAKVYMLRLYIYTYIMDHEKHVFHGDLPGHPDRMLVVGVVVLLRIRVCQVPRLVRLRMNKVIYLEESWSSS